MKALNPGHYLMGCRLDVWLRLLRDNRGTMDPRRLPQRALLTLTAAALSPFALAEKQLYKGRIAAAEPTRDPVFILGHWRSGTTYLQNILSRDAQFGWADPVGTTLFPYRFLLGRALRGGVGRGLKDGRPMDNVQYSLELPMEETFALSTISTRSIIHMIAFPAGYERYIRQAFPQELPPAEQEDWRRAYSYVIRKLTLAHDGRQLLLKSPDNTAHIALLQQLYPDARYINIHRDPYRTIASTIHMFRVQMDRLRLTREPENLDEIIEDAVIDIFRRMYEQLFALRDSFPPNRLVDVPYAEFCARPVESLRDIYDRLELSGFDEARPAFEAYAAEQKDYVKNRFALSPTLCRKINASLDFYFTRYGYEKQEVPD